MKTRIKQRHAGYSIIEMLVYIAIFSAMSIVVIESIVVVIRSFETTRADRDLLESGHVSMEHMSREIRQAKSITVSGSVLNTNPGTVSLSGLDSSNNPRTVIFVLENSTIDMYENGELVGPILNANISAQSLVFRRIATPEGEAVKVEMMVSNTSQATPLSANFYDTIILRGEYPSN